MAKNARLKITLPQKERKGTAVEFVERLNELRSDAELKKYHRYFTFDENESGAGDRFMGVRMGHVFNLAKEFWGISLGEIEKLLENPIHEVRAGGCSIMARQAENKKTVESGRKKLFDLYIRRHDRINDWDLVDLASYKVVGSYLYDFNKPRKILYQLAQSKNPWERRTAIVSTAHFIRKGDVEDAFRISELLVNDSHDLVNKATGWMLRFAGDKDRRLLLKFLDKYGATMPRSMLRNSIEKLDKTLRTYYLGMKNKTGED